MTSPIRTERHDDVLVISVRPSVNLNALTIEQVIAKMQTSHLQLLELLTTDLRFAGVPLDALTPLTSLKLEAEQRTPDWYNSTSNYNTATSLALTKQVAVFRMLVDP